MDSSVFVEIPASDLKEFWEYRMFMDELEMKWMRKFNGNEHYRIAGEWNEENGIGGKFGENRFDHCKLYHFDGTELGYGENDWRTKRGLWIRDHYSKEDVVKCQMIADNLCDFLTQEKVEHKRINFDMETRKPVVK